MEEKSNSSTSKPNKGTILYYLYNKKDNCPLGRVDSEVPFVCNDEEFIKTVMKVRVEKDDDISIDDLIIKQMSESEIVDFFAFSVVDDVWRLYFKAERKIERLERKIRKYEKLIAKIQA